MGYGGDGMSAATVSLLFFIYTLLLMLTCTLGSSVSLCSYLVTHGKAHLAFTVLFAAYLIEQGVAFSWSYSGFPDLSYETEGIIGAALLLIELAISTVIVASALWAVLEHVGRASRSLVFAPSLALAALQVIGLMAIKDQTTYQWLFYAARTILLIAALVWSFLRGKDNDVNETRHPSNQRRICWIIVALLVATLCMDSVIFAVSDRLAGLPQDSLIRHVCERNLFENTLVIFLAIRVVMRGSSILALRFKEPPTGSSDLDELRFERFAERCRLTPTERTVAMHLIEGKKINAIAAELVVAEGTVKTHMSHIYKKARCANRKELLQRFWEC